MYLILSACVCVSAARLYERTGPFAPIFVYFVRLECDGSVLTTYDMVLQHERNKQTSVYNDDNNILMTIRI